FTYLAISPFVLQGLFGLSPQGFSAAFAVNAAGFVVGGQANRPLIRWLSTEQRLLTGVGIILTGGLSLLLAALFTVPPLALVLLAFFAVASGYGLTSPNCAALAMTGNRERAGTASALFGLSLYGLGSVVAPISGLLAASLIPTAATITTLAAAASVTTLLLLIQRRRTVRRSLRFQATSRTTSNSP
ncbi:MAG TPA: MFS transporter, partial [Mycobacterium sp.]|nr:MFS transporter [Mycobacterium sp.]